MKKKVKFILFTAPQFVFQSYARWTQYCSLGKSELMHLIRWLTWRAPINGLLRKLCFKGLGFRSRWVKTRLKWWHFPILQKITKPPVATVGRLYYLHSSEHSSGRCPFQKKSQLFVPIVFFAFLQLTRHWLLKRSVPPIFTSNKKKDPNVDHASQWFYDWSLGRIGIRLCKNGTPQWCTCMLPCLQQNLTRC